MEVVGLTHNLIDAWQRPGLFLARGLEQHRTAVNEALEKINSAGSGKELPASSIQEPFTDTAVANPLISKLHTLNRASVGTLK